MDLPIVDQAVFLQLQARLSAEQERQRKHSAIAGGRYALADALFEDVALFMLSLEPDYNPAMGREERLKAAAERLHGTPRDWSDKAIMPRWPTCENAIFHAKVHAMFNFVREWIEAAREAK